MSQVDTFDYKPELAKRAGKPFDPEGKLQFFASKPGNCQPSFWKFSQHGESGLWVSDLFPRLAKHVDSIAFLNSMHSKTALHGPACFMMNTGFTLPGFPAWALGSPMAWVARARSYLLTLSYLILAACLQEVCSIGEPVFFPRLTRAVTLDFRDEGRPIADLYPPETLRALTDPVDQKSLDF